MLSLRVNLRALLDELLRLFFHALLQRLLFAQVFRRNQFSVRIEIQNENIVGILVGFGDELIALHDGPLNVTAVVEKTGLSQALVSKHLKLLTIAGVVQRRPEGSLVFYEVIDRGVYKLLAQAEKLMLASRRQQLDALAAIL